MLQAECIFSQNAARIKHVVNRHMHFLSESFFCRRAFFVQNSLSQPGNILYSGNQALHEITVHGLYEMRINLYDFNGNKRFAKYSNVRVSNEKDGYRLRFSGFTGNTG